jgi:LysR family transcriptional regulator, glycine cleavage system transcriptional activator
MRHIPSATGLRAFEAAARSMSFVHAARELNVTPGAVSRQIQSLEVYLGADLFTRRHKQVDLTPLGRDYLADIAAPLERVAAATARIRDRAAVGTGAAAISICAYPTFAIRWLIPRWSRFYDRRPDIDLRLTTTLNPVDFERDDYDLAIVVAVENARHRGLTQNKPGLIQHKLLDVDVFPVCSPAVAADIHTPDDLARCTLIHSAPRPGDWRRWLDTVGETGVDANGGLHFESLNLALHAAIEDIGVAMGIDALIGEELRQGRLVRPFGDPRYGAAWRSGSPFHIVYPTEKASNPKLTAFRDWLLDEAGAVGVKDG